MSVSPSSQPHAMETRVRHANTRSNARADRTVEHPVLRQLSPDARAPIRRVRGTSLPSTAMLRLSAQQCRAVAAVTVRVAIQVLERRGLLRTLNAAWVERQLHQRGL